MQQPPNESSDPNPENWQSPQPPSQPLPPPYSQPPPNTYYPQPPYSQSADTYYAPPPPYQQPIQPPPYPQPGQYQPMMPPPPPKKPRRGWIIAGIVIGALILCGVISNALPKSATTDTTSTATATQQTQATDTPQPTQTTQSQPTSATDTHPHFSDGTFEVGKDIQPGTYRTRVASPNCYYARLKGFGGTTDDIVANDNTDTPAIVTISATDKGFQSNNCGTWTKE